MNDETRAPSEVYLLPRGNGKDTWRHPARVDGPGPHGFIDPATPKREAVRYVLSASPDSAPAQEAVTPSWRPIETAPKDGSLIVGLCNHAADPYYDGDRLTEYGARVEGLSHVEDGPHVLVWEGAREESDGWESPSYTIPGGWTLSDDPEKMANPVGWMPLPLATPPAQEAAAVHITWNAQGQRLVNGVPDTAAQQPATSAVAWVNKANILSANISRERQGPYDQHTWSECRTAYHDTPLAPIAPEPTSSPEIDALVEEARRLGIEVANEHFKAGFQAGSGERINAGDACYLAALNFAINALAAAARKAQTTEPAQPAAPVPVDRAVCEWSPDGEGDELWFPSCGGDPWRFDAGDPTANGTRFCMHCGKRMKQMSEPLTATPTANAEPVGEAVAVPGAPAFTMACFKAADVPVGTKLYATHVDDMEPLNMLSVPSEWPADYTKG